MFRCTRFASLRQPGLLAPTVGGLGKRTNKAKNPFPNAKRTVIYTTGEELRRGMSETQASSPLSHSSSSPSSLPSDGSRHSADTSAHISSTHDNRKTDSTTAAMTSPTDGVLKDFKTLNFPQMEEEVLKMWREKDCFKESVRQSEGKPPFVFYDGPPFATGLPHYGHILAGTIKDMVPRFAHQTGHHVVRRFGWDTHGLPIEFEIDKQLGIKMSSDVLDYGIGNYNEECRAIVMRYATEWRSTVERVGRWVNFDDDYKTMNLSYMESVWWVFSQLWEKDLVYRGYKVMPFSTGCTTPLSNFEAGLDYRDVTDPAVTVAFQSSDDANVFYLAWTTTPWTLPSNLSLCVNASATYVKILDTKTQRHYIMAEERVHDLYPPEKKKKGQAEAEAHAAPYTIVEKCQGTSLVGKRYVPLFGFFAELMKDTAFRIIEDDYVTTDSGTGLVHQAPAFGEEDFNVCIKHGIIVKGGTIVCPVDENGRFTADVSDFAGQYVKDADANIIKALEQSGNLIRKQSIVHSYPYCWRSHTPLLYKAVDSWFVKVESLRDRLVAANDKTYWVPDFVKTARFSNWLENARDWNISRNRYWGTPLPIWHSEDWEEVVIISSVAQLEELSGRTGITDIHRHLIDDLTIPSKRPGQPPLRRVTEVFDCWFESGSMPYAQDHYPFESQEKFTSRFPADFVAEGLDQTRGWFYTLLVLGVALFDQSPFRNVCVNGLILAEDGKKMSKSLKNYPDPRMVIDEYGADALRMYIINSPVVRGEPLRFREAGVKGVVKDVMLPLFNAAKFFIANVNACVKEGGEVSMRLDSPNEMDRWILASSQSLLRYVKTEMLAYHLYNVVPGILRFVGDLSNWYVRMNRRRMKGGIDAQDRCNALSTMLVVLFDVARISGHIAPFVAEILFQHIKPLLPAEFQVDSVHYLMIPDERPELDDENLERAMNRMINVVELVRVLRDRIGITMKRPVRQVVIVHPDPTYLEDVRRVTEYIKDEVNSFEVVLSDGKEYVDTYLDVNFEALGKRFRKEVPAIRKAVQAMSAEQVAAFIHNAGGVVAEKELTLDDVRVLRKFKEGITDFESNTDNDVVVLVDKREDAQLIASWRAREFVNRVQQLRKKAGLHISDCICVYYSCEDEEVVSSIESCADQVNQTLPVGSWKPKKDLPADAVCIAIEDNNISGASFELVFTKA